MDGEGVRVRWVVTGQQKGVQLTVQAEPLWIRRA